jgi:hypothetical protein
MSDDVEARHRRAARLRQQIAELMGKRESKAGTGDSSKDAVTEQSGRRRPPRIHHASPRSFIEKRMHDLNGDKKDKL